MKQGLTQLAAQLAGAWKQLGINQRVSLVIATGALLAGLTTLVLFSSRTSYSLLYGNLDETEAGRVVAALDEAKVPYQISGSGTIRVPADKVHSLRMQLATKGIPRGEGVGYEIFDRSNFGMSDFAQWVNFHRALEGELARTICQLDAIEAAKVQLNIPRNRLIIDQDKKATGSVFVRVRGNAQLPSSAVNAIRFVVANSVEGLSVNQVSVVDNMGNLLSENEEDNSMAGLSNQQLKARREYEAYLRRKVEDMLNKVLGPGQSVVEVAAEISWDSMTRYEVKYDPAGQVVRTETTTEKEVESATSTGGASPGVSANTVVDTNAVASAAPVVNNKTKEKETRNNYDVGQTISSFLQNGGKPQRLSAAVFVAQRFEGAGADRKPLPRTPEELQKLRRVVQSALGIVENGGTRNDEITLEETVFNDQPWIEATQTLDRLQQRQFYLDLGHKFLYPALGLAIVFLFWRSFRSTRSEDFSLGIPLMDLSPGPGGEHGGNGKTLRSGEPKVVTVDVLNQLIRENPSNMTQAVRTWLTRGKPAK